MESSLKVTSIHIIFAIFASILSAGASLGWFGFKNDIISIVFLAVFVYIAGQICQKLYKDDVEGFSAWLWDGIVPAFLVWIMVYTLLFNYL
ncbi:hypothetical protein [Methanobrevibacter sp. DSM 116169]|uniref:EMC6-like membrane protein n=1 Tax=Methanobrevibacter sp. DSM 116169 TaxID=3242727 RepID=UPI0038FC720D